MMLDAMMPLFLTTNKHNTTSSCLHCVFHSLRLLLFPSCLTDNTCFQTPCCLMVRVLPAELSVHAVLIVLPYGHAHPFRISVLKQ